MPFYTQASCHFAPFGLLKHSVQVSSKQDEQDSAEWMSMSCCCSPVVCQCCSEPHQSLTSVSVQHGQPPSPPLSLALSSSTIPPISLSSVSLSSHTWKPAWLMPVRGTSFNMKMRKVGVGLPDKTNEHIQIHTTTHTLTHKYTHQFPLHGPERVIEGEGLVTLIVFGLLVSFRLFPVGTCKHTQISCINVCM